jgi:hypothetical protein
VGEIFQLDTKLPHLPTFKKCKKGKTLSNQLGELRCQSTIFWMLPFQKRNRISS